MAIDLTGSNQVHWGDLGAIAGLSNITVQFLWKADFADLSSNQGWFAQFTDPGNGSFRVDSGDGTNLDFLLIDSTGSARSRRATFTPGQFVEHVIACTWQTSDDEMTIWDNGVQIDDADGFTGALGTLDDSSVDVTMGQDASGASCQDGQFSHATIWGRRVTDAEIVSMGANRVSPLFYPADGILHARMTNTGDLRNVWGTEAGTNSGGSNAEQPRIFNPGEHLVFPPAAVAAGGTPFHHFLRRRTG